jgi:hypothetical protein
MTTWDSMTVDILLEHWKNKIENPMVRELGQHILALTMNSKDIGVCTLREYLIALVARLWVEDEGFSGKRPFGNSGWQGDVMRSLAREGLIKGTYDDDSDEAYVPFDWPKGSKLVALAIEML